MPAEIQVPHFGFVPCWASVPFVAPKSSATLGQEGLRAQRRQANCMGLTHFLLLATFALGSGLVSHYFRKHAFSRVLALQKPRTSVCIVVSAFSNLRVLSRLREFQCLQFGCGWWCERGGGGGGGCVCGLITFLSHAAAMGLNGVSCV